MRYLYLDTSTSYLYCAVVVDNSILFQIKDKLNNNLSTFTLSTIEKKFKENNLTPNDIDKIIVVNGPGSFTGVRIGVTIAKTWAWSLNIPITTISSLTAMAVSCEKDCYKVPIIDARRDCYYAGIYDKDNKNILEDCHISREELLLKLDAYKENYEFIGVDELEDNILEYDPNMLEIVNFAKNKECINPHAVNPNYLKLTEAEEKLK